MAKKETYPSGLTSIEFADRKLAYKGPETLAFLSDREKIREFLGLIHRMDAQQPVNHIISDTNFKIEYKPKPQSFAYGKRRSWHYKVDHSGESYFAKRTVGRMVEQTGGGQGEIIAAEDARELLKHLDWVEVADYQIGYQDDRESFVITKWQPALELTIEEYLKTNPDNAELVRERAKELKKILKGFYNVREDNMAYDLATGKVILYDLNEKPKKEADDKLIKV